MNFREIIAQLSYSPSMIWHLASYAKKLRIEKKQIHRIILFCLLNITLLAYSIAINDLDSQSSFIPRGTNTNVTTDGLVQNNLIDSWTDFNNFAKDSFLNKLFSNINTSDIYRSFNIAPETITDLKITNSYASYAPQNQCFEISRHSFRGDSRLISNVKNTTLYISQCLATYYGPVLVGKNSNQDFAILNNGNLLLKSDRDVIYSTEAIVPTINVVNSTTHTTSAQLVSLNQTLTYQLSFTNNTNLPINREVIIDTSSIDHFANLISNQDKGNSTWLISDLKPGETSYKELSFDIDKSPRAYTTTLNSSISPCAIHLRADNSIVTTNFACETIKNLNSKAIEITPSYFILQQNNILSILVIFFSAVVIVKLIRLAEIKILEDTIKQIRHSINQGGF